MDRQYDYIVTQDEAGGRLDRFIADKETELSRSHVQKLIADGCVTIGDSRAKSSYGVHAGDVVRLRLPAPKLNNGLRAENIPLDIVFEDDEVIVIDKPAGMVVHPGAGVSSGTLANAVSERISPELHALIPDRPGIVHRLDKGTSGTIVVVKTTASYYNLVEQFKEHSTRRKYVALVCGTPRHDSGIITAPIGRSRRDRKKMAVTSANSKEAITRFSVTEYYGKFSLLEIMPRTGRTHQIRVHLSHIGCPVVGDLTYGGRNRAIKTAESQIVKTAFQNLSRQALHAQLLGFAHPRTGEYMEFSTPAPEDMQNVINALRAEE